MIRGALLSGFILAIIAFITTSTFLTVAYLNPADVMSPHDRIHEGQIHIYPDKIVIEVKDATWASYTNTNSMDPLLDTGANGLEITPKNEDDIYRGDIVAYESKITPGLIIHRIVDIKEDEEGKYFIFKGDNNNTSDPEKVRFSQIKYILIGIIY